jgi:peptidoglycan/LPS O-acetylase OafA/YrhL
MVSEPMKRFSGQQTELGVIAVNCFFLISGFLIIRSFEGSEGTGAYLRKRILRICPGFFVAFLFSLLIAGPLGTIDATHPFGNWAEYFQALSYRRFALDFLTLQAPHAPATFETLPLARFVNASLWTIQHEFFCYLLVPVIAAAGIFRKKQLILVLLAAFYVLLLLQHLPWFEPYKNISTKIFNYPSYIPRFIVYFLAGGCCYLYRHKLVRDWRLALLSLAILIFAAVSIKGFNLLFPFAGTYLLFYTAYHPKLNFSGFARKGDLSYGTYLYAWPLQQLVLYFSKDQIGFTAFFLLSLAATLVFAFASWHLVEQPFLRLKNKQVKPKQVPQQVAVAE